MRYKFLERVIEGWPLRIKRAGLKQYEVADRAGVSREHFSALINLKIDNPRLNTIEAIDGVLAAEGV